MTTVRARLDALAWLDRRRTWERRLAELEGTRLTGATTTKTRATA